MSKMISVSATGQLTLMDFWFLFNRPVAVLVVILFEYYVQQQDMHKNKII